MTMSIISWLLCTNCDLIILKHLIGEKGQRLFSPPCSWKQYNCIVYFIFKWKEENIQAHIDIITTKSNNSSYVQVCYYHDSIHEHTQLNAMNTAGGDGLGLSTHCCHVHNKQKHPGNKPPNTYLSVHNNATTLGKYILYTTFISTFISPKCKSPLLNTKQRANRIGYIYNTALDFVLCCFFFS